MIAVIFTIWCVAITVAVPLSLEMNKHWIWVVTAFLSLLWIVPFFTGIDIESGHGQYKGYVTAVEQNGLIFKGWTAYLKTELESSNEDVACINRNDSKLIDDLQQAQEQKKNISLTYKENIQYGIGECPGSTWMITDIK